MKIIICTTPIRPEPTSYPPFGSMALIQSLREKGYDPFFYDIDGLRPTFEEVTRFFGDQAPDIVGISAVVSTAYAYTKNLASAIKEVSPNTKIVVGGNLAASSEILLRFSNVDVCGIGEGENVMVNLAEYWDEHPTGNDYSQLRRIKGIAYLDGSDDVIFTGYDAPIPASDFLSPDWGILDQYSKIENFVQNPLSRHDFAQDARTYEPHRQGKMLATAITAKGCVARCPFCHRWDRGYRHWEVDRIIENVQYLIDRYNVGFIGFGDENFGSDRRKTDEFIERIKELDVLYQVTGVRCRSVDPDVLSRLKESGCVAMYYGMETGSPDILNIMEKNTDLEDNINAALWTYEAGIYTIYQMVLGMPGENPQTVAETSKFIQSVTEYLPDPPYRRLSINYIQALPGTPVYEYARETGLIGKSLEEEEKYLISISDINAVDDATFLNFTGHDYFSVQSWRQKILFDATANWYKTRNWKRLPKAPLVTASDGAAQDEEVYEDYSKGGYFNLRRSIISHPYFFRILASPIGMSLRYAYLASFILVKNLLHLPKKRFLAYLGQFVFRKIVRPSSANDSRSLRQVMKERTSPPITVSEEGMLPMREGR